MPSLSMCLGIDLACVAVVLVYVYRSGTAWHPLVIYLFYHIFTVTWRAWSVAFGEDTLYSGYEHLEKVTLQEMSRAIVCCDASLVSLFAGVFIAARQRRNISSRYWAQDIRHLSRKDAKAVVVLLMPIGLAALIAVRLGVANELTRGYLSMIAFWPINIICLLVYVFGFRRWLLLLALPYLLIVGLQGYHRFMVVLPAMFLVALALMRSGRRWPAISGVLFCLAVVLTFPSWKVAGRAFHSDGVSEAFTVVVKDIEESLSDWRTESTLLDQIACGMTLHDQRGGYYGGLTYTYVFTLPVPRAMWPDKPGLVEHIVDFSTQQRPMAKEGRVIGLTGESYVNFGYPGVVLVPFLFGLVAGIFYVRAMLEGQGALVRYLYLVFMTTLIQVYRDGLGALLLFGLFKNSQVIVVLALARVRKTFK